MAIMWHLPTKPERCLAAEFQCAIVWYMKIAVVDDNAVLNESVCYILKEEGYSPVPSADGAEAWEKHSLDMPDFFILDVMMPKMDGLELCRKIRSVSESVPILFLTSRDQEIDRVLGLELGADDYICKPFSNRELIARIRAISRRFVRQTVAVGAGGGQDSMAGAHDDGRVIAAGGLNLYPDAFRVTFKGRDIQITVTEFRILESLVSAPGIVKTREQLMQAAYEGNVFVSDRTIDTHVKRIRHKIGDQEFNAIETVYGLGYRLKA